MDVSSKLKVTLLTGRTIEQGVGKECGKASEDYFVSVAICYVDPEDLKRLSVREGTNVRVSTDYGSVILKALKSPRGPHQGVVFIPYGLWANAVVSSETDSIGMPSLKGIPAEIEPATNEVVLGLRELLRQQFGKE
jgi:formylmethanofuran dehydrogenase subunit D